MTAERIDTADATRITGLSMRGLQAMAQRTFLETR